MPETDEVLLSATKKMDEELQKFSQCTYDILQIVKTIIEHPGEYKELHQKYFDLSNSLDSMMSSFEGFKFIDEKYVLPWDFLYLPYREESDRKVLYRAETSLRDLLGRIEAKRRFLLGKEYKPNTGLKDPELREMLKNIENGKNIEKESLAQWNNKEDIPDIEQEIEISNTVKNKYKGIKMKRKKGKGSIQFEKGGRWINLGSYNTRTYKMAEYILMPTSKSKKVIDVYEHIKLPKDNKITELGKSTLRSYELKKEIIKKAFFELQKDKYLKGHISKLKFSEEERAVTFDFK